MIASDNKQDDYLRNHKDQDIDPIEEKSKRYLELWRRGIIVCPIITDMFREDDIRIS